MNRSPSPRTLIRRLAAADGYLDLGMPRQALEELAMIGDFGPLDAPAQFLRGKALKAQENYVDAIEPLERAAKLIPAPFSAPIWKMLGECFRHEGQNDQADAADVEADASFAQAPEGSGTPMISIQIVDPAAKTKTRRF
jgi:tetratricopeptide (TPR) repeat protein